MSSFKVKYEGLKEAVTDWLHISNQIQGSIDRLGSVINNLAGNDTINKFGYTGSVTDVKDKLSALQKEFQEYSKKIKEIEELYRKNEAEVINILEEQGIDAHEYINNLNKQKGLTEAANLVVGKLWDKYGSDKISFEYNADPVNMNTGNYIYDRELIRYDSDLPASFSVFYNAMDRKSGSLGTGWVHSFEKHLFVYDKGIYIREDDGSVTVFIKNGDSYVARNDRTASLEEKKDGYLYTRSPNIFYRFDQNGNWKEISSPRFNCVLTAEYEDRLLKKVNSNEGISYVFDYDENRMLSAVTDQGGRKISFEYENRKMVRITDARGSVYSYEYSLDGYLYKVINPNGTVALRNYYDEYGRVLEQRFADEGKNTISYDEDKQSVYLTQQNGNVIQYVHDDEYRSSRVIYEDGQESSEYNEYGDKISFTDKNGNTYSFVYDENGKLTDIVKPIGSISLTYDKNSFIDGMKINDDLIYRAEYDEHGHETSFEDGLGNAMKKIFDDKGRLIECVQQDGSTLKVEYDDNSNISSFIDPSKGRTDYEYDEFKRVVSSTDALGRKTRFEYDNNDNLVCVINPEGNKKTYEYDEFNNLVSITDFDGSQIHAQYNQINKLEKYIDQEGNETVFDYDLMWNVVRKQEANGAETFYEYDKLNRLSAITYPDGGTERAWRDPNGNIIKRVAQDGGVYEIEYDELNRGILIKDPVGSEKRFKYGNFDNIREIDHGNGVIETFEYDVMGRCIRSVGADGYAKYYSYDPLGNLTSVSDDKSWLEKYEYYPGGLLKKISEINGSYKEIEYDAVGNIIGITMPEQSKWTFRYDLLDRVIEVRNSKGLLENYEYDAAGRLTAIIDGLGNKTSYKYNKVGNVNSVTDPSGNETSYQYDSCQRLIAVLQKEESIDPGDLNSLNEQSKNHRFVARYTRDKSGRVISSFDAENNETKIEYDLCGRIINKILPEGNGISIEYNADGTRRSFELNDGRKAVYEYDAMKQLVELKDWIGTISYERNKSGNITKTTNFDGSQTEYQYDARRNRTGIKYPNGDLTEYKYDEFNRLNKVISGNDVVNYHYNDFGTLIRKEYPHNYYEQYDHSFSDYVPNVRSFHNGTLVNEISYQFDAKGQIIRKTNGSQSLSYEYDKAGQLSSVSSNNALMESYSYDAFGNRVRSSRNGNETLYQYNRLNQLIKRIDIDQSSEYSYDRNGNLISQINSNGSQISFAYDTADYLSSATSIRGVASYQTDSLGNRIRSDWTIGDQKTVENYYYDLTKDYSNLISRNIDSSFVNIIRDETLLAENNNYYSLNENFSPVLALNASGMTSFTYDSFGASDNKLLYVYPDQSGFTGYLHDPITGLYHADQREYDPYNGIFTSMDPLAGMMLIPLSYNAYRYCLNDPINYWDPSGLIAAWVVGGIFGAVKRTVATTVKAVGETLRTGSTSVKWQDFAGSVTGGFTEGATYVAVLSTTGNVTTASALSKSAGDAVDTFTSSSLKHAFNEKGYRKEDGYSWGNVFADTGSSAMSGLAKGTVEGLVSKIKMGNGIMRDITNQARSFKQQLTNAVRNGVNLHMDTLKNGIIAGGWDAIVKGVPKQVAKAVNMHVKNGLDYIYSESDFNVKAYCLLTRGGADDLIAADAIAGWSR